MDSVDIPENPEDVTETWLLKVLQTSLGSKEEIQVLELVSLKTVGYLSTACKAKIQIGNRFEKLFMKFTLPNEDQFNAFINQYHLDEREVLAYNDIIPKLIEFEQSFIGSDSKLAEKLPKFYAGGASAQGFFIILEDVSDNFQIRDVTQDMSIHDICLGMEFIAYFHALSYAYSIKNDHDWSQQVPVIAPYFLQDKSLLEALDQGFKLFIKDLKQSEASDKTLKGAQMMQKSYLETFPKYLGIMDKSFLGHGDYWCNNVMYGPENGVKVIDWQFIGAMPPMLDFTFWAFTNCHPDIVKDNLEKVCHTYYDKFATSCQQFQVEVPFSLDQFKQDMTTKGMTTMFILYMFFYDPVGQEPKMSQRLRAVFEHILQEDPDFIET